MSSHSRNSESFRKALSKIEVWKDIPNYEGRYQASTWGRVKSLVSRRVRGKDNVLRQVKDRLLSPSACGRYYAVGLHKDGKQKTWNIHTLVLITFVGPCPKGMNARHFPDRNTSNNRLDNLSWATQLINQRDRFAHNTHSRGERNAAAKLVVSDVKLILQLGELDENRGNTTKRLLFGRMSVYGRNARVRREFIQVTGKTISLTVVGQILRGTLWKEVPRLK